MSNRPAAPRDDLSDLTAEIADQIESFVIAVGAVARGDEPGSAVSMLLLEVSQLLLAGGRLGAIVDVVPDDDFETDLGLDPDPDQLRSMLAIVLGPIDEYMEVFDPYAPEPELVHERLSDDVADVVATLVHGLAHYKAGRSSEALWWWQFSYLSTWGGTASSALRALQSVVSHVRLDGGVEATADMHAATLITELVKVPDQPG